MPYTDELHLATLTIQLTSLLTKHILHSLPTATTKTDHTPVTLADFASQALLISSIRHAFPSDTFIGEEAASVLRENSALRQQVWDLVSSIRLDDPSDALITRPASIDEMLDAIDAGGMGKGGKGRVWIMDPLDGTASFLRGEQYAVSLALVEDGEEKVGVVGCPNLPIGVARIEEGVTDDEGYGVMLSAVRGEGVWMRPMGKGGLLPATRVAVGDGPEDLSNVHIVDSAKGNGWRQDRLRIIAGEIGAVYPGTDLWSSHMRYVGLVLGGGDVQLRIPGGPKESSVCVWDHAGLHLILSEAGCVVTDLDGESIDFGAGRKLAWNFGVLAAKKGVHQRLLRVAQRVLDMDVGRK
ncbi:hypothetical protein OQA88_2271 [Cercophora sp. LCS_1]